MPEDASSTTTIARDQLRALIERIEYLAHAKSELSDDIKDVYAEAKSNGFAVAIIREIVKLRKQRPEDRAEREALLDTYMAALGELP